MQPLFSIIVFHRLQNISVRAIKCVRDRTKDVMGCETLDKQWVALSSLGRHYFWPGCQIYTKCESSNLHIRQLQLILVVRSHRVDLEGSGDQDSPLPHHKKLKPIKQHCS